MAADALERNGLSLEELSDETLSVIREKSPVWAVPSNPLDIEPITEVMGFVDAYTLGLNTLLSDKKVDSCIVQHGTIFRSEEEIQFVLEAREKYPQKPIAVCIIGFKDIYDELYVLYEKNKIPVYPTVERAARALGALHRRRQYLAKL